MKSESDNSNYRVISISYDLPDCSACGEYDTLDNADAIITIRSDEDGSTDKVRMKVGDILHRDIYEGDYVVIDEDYTLRRAKIESSK